MLRPVAGWAYTSTVIRFETLERRGCNYQLSAAPDGGLFMVLRSGGNGLNNQMTNVYAAKYDPDARGWSTSRFVAADCSCDIENNQPAIVYDPATGGARLVFAGNYRRVTRVASYAVNQDVSAVNGPFQLMGTGPLFPDAPVAEIRQVGLAMAADGHLWGGWTYVSGTPAYSGVYISNDGASNGEERATDPSTDGDQFSLAVGPSGRPHLVTLCGGTETNAAWVYRDALGAQFMWTPTPVKFTLPGAPAAIACLATGDETRLDCAFVTDLGGYYATMVAALQRSWGAVVVTNPACLHLWNHTDNAPTGFNARGIRYTRSPLGHEAIAYAMDRDQIGPLDLAVVMVKPRGVAWPLASFTDANNDGVHDDMAGLGVDPRNIFNLADPPPYFIFAGTQGRYTIMFKDGETPAVAFSRESLWVVYHDAAAGTGRVAQLVFAETDLDADGMYDAWETRHGFNPENAADASGNPDDDAYNNLEEFIADTDPTNANPPMAIAAWSNPPGGAFFFESSPRRNCGLDFTPNLSPPAWSNVAGQAGAATNGLSDAWFDQRQAPAGFYRAHMRLP